MCGRLFIARRCSRPGLVSVQLIVCCFAFGVMRVSVCFMRRGLPAAVCGRLGGVPLRLFGVDMWPQIIGGIVSAGSSLLGGLMGNKAASDDQAKNIAMQKEFAQNGVQWKVADAQKAGISPLAALGASTPSFSPVPLGSDGGGSSFADAGQDIGRAISATATNDQKMDAYTVASQKLALEHGTLENDLLRSQIARLNQTSMPGFPAAVDSGVFPGQGDGPRHFAVPNLAFDSNKPAGSWKASPGAQANDVENEYGNVAGDAYGLLKLLADGATNAGYAIDNGVRWALSPSDYKWVPGKGFVR